MGAQVGRLDPSLQLVTLLERQGARLEAIKEEPYIVGRQRVGIVGHAQCLRFGGGLSTSPACWAARPSQDSIFHSSFKTLRSIWVSNAFTRSSTSSYHSWRLSCRLPNRANK